ncbi:MAG: hypothetical protein E7603_09170 [Ruminococcaceae bacterium]|nr:hypothetical protein [Oscillospiraceae bacterium]
MKIKIFRALLCFALTLFALTAFTACKKNHDHNFDEWVVLREPTCTKQGIERRYCSCGEHESRPIEATGHTEGEWKTDVQPTCLNEGTRIQSCTVCHATLNTETLDAKGHNENGNWIVETPASCDQPGESYKICSDCGLECDRRTDVLHHLPGTIVTEAEATCTQEGKKCQYCKHCNQLLASVVIPKLNHEYVTENGQSVCKHCKEPENS